MASQKRDSVTHHWPGFCDALRCAHTSYIGCRFILNWYKEQITNQTLHTTTTEKIRQNIDMLAFVSWLFLIGSLIFQIDAVLEIIESLSFHAVLHFSAGLLFTIGSVLFVVHDAQQK
jgi:hypothetical protein